MHPFNELQERLTRRRWLANSAGGLGVAALAGLSGNLPTLGAAEAKSEKPEHGLPVCLTSPPRRSE